MKTKVALLLLIVLVILWGISWPINKIGLYYTTPFNFNELRFTIGTVVSFLIVLLTKNFVIPRKKDLPLIFMMATFQMGLTMSLSNYGLSIVGAGKATFLVYTTSIWLIPLSSLIHRRKIKLMEVFSLLIGIFGVCFLINPWQEGWYEDRIWVGDLTILLASFCWAIGILGARHMKWHRTPLQLLPWELLLCAVGTTLFAMTQGVSYIPKRVSFEFIGTLLYSGFVVIGIGQWIMLLISKHLKPSFVSFGLIWIPLVALGISTFFLGEKITLPLGIGVVLIMIGIFFHIVSENQHEKELKKYPEVP